ncbi:MAG: helix-turn-helix transcriptional regulator [Chloroflexi bacterium]|nr:helix-turn-helix transcriptional regulator [Chloroflexota bacterium]
MATNHLTGFCPHYHEAVELIGRRWSGAILRSMLSGAQRFSEIGAPIPGLSDRLLSERLKEFESAGLAERTVIPDTPVRVEYRLTDKGRSLRPVVAALTAWAEEWLGAGVSCDVDAGRAANEPRARNPLLLWSDRPPR